MKKKYFVLLLIAIIIIGLGCSWYYYSMAPPHSEKEGVIIGTTQTIGSLDPALRVDKGTTTLYANIAEGLVRYKVNTSELELGLAENYSISSDGLVYTFELKKGLKFTDGTPFNATSVKHSIDRVMTLGGDSAWLAQSTIDKVNVVDEYVVQITLQNPCGYFLSVLAHPCLYPISPKAYPADKFNESTVGGIGPYMITGWDRDVELDLEANPNYYSKPKTPYIVVRFFSDSTTLRLALERGDVDVVLRGLTATDIVDFKNKPSDFKVKEFPGIRIGIFMLNLKHPPFDNILVRRALAYVVDRKAIVEKVFFNTSEPCYSLVPRGWFTHVDAFKEKYGEYGEIGLETARDLLRAAGYNETNKLIFDLYYTPTQYGKEEGDMAIVLKENFERTEMISVNLKNEEWSTFMEHLAKSTLPTLIIHWSPDYYDPDTYLYALLHSGTYISEAFGYSNPEIDSLLDHGRVAPTNERGVIYEQVQRLASEEAWIIPTIQEKVTAVSKSNVEGIVATEIMDWEFQFVEVTK